MNVGSMYLMLFLFPGFIMTMLPTDLCGEHSKRSCQFLLFVCIPQFHSSELSVTTAGLTQEKIWKQACLLQVVDHHLEAVEAYRPEGFF